MKKKNAKIKNTLHLFYIAACFAWVSSPAFSATLKTKSIIESDIVTVGDVFEGAEPYTNRYLAPAPSVDSPLHLSASDLTRISNAFHLEWTPVTGQEHLLIQRASNRISSTEIENAVKEKISEQLNGQKFALEFTSRSSGLQLPAGVDKNINVENVSVNMQNGTFTARIAVAASNPVIKQNVTGRVYTLVDVPVLNTPLRKDDIIGINDLDSIEMRADALPNNIIVDAEKLIGQTPRRGISSMKPIAQSDITAPLAVKKGDLVTIVMQNGILNLTLQGRALQNGAEGEVIRIVNTASNRTIEGTITGPQTIAMNLPSSKL